MNPSTIRKAAELTQAELAAALGHDDSAVTKLEGRDNLMLATLAKYLNAAGVDAALEYDLEST